MTDATEIQTEFRDCPACGSGRVASKPDLAPAPWVIGACGNCDFVFLRNPVDYEALEVEHAWEATYEATHREREAKRGPLRRFARRVRHLSYRIRGDRARRYLRYLRPGPTLDIGCGDVVRFKPPFIPYGIELSKAMSAVADREMRSLGGYCLQGAGAERIKDFPEGHFDGVLMHSYLEHEVNFKRILEGAFRAPKPGGHAFIRVPNFSALNRRLRGAEWAGFRHPDHVNYFTPETLAREAKAAGFTFQLVNRHKIWLDDNIQALATKPAA